MTMLTMIADDDDGDDGLAKYNWQHGRPAAAHETEKEAFLLCTRQGSPPLPQLSGSRRCNAS